METAEQRVVGGAEAGAAAGAAGAARAAGARRWVETHMGRWSLSRMLGNPRGRATFLSFMADAEESDEEGVFDMMLAKVDDPELHKLVKIHADDERRHAQMLHEAAARAGVAPLPFPSDLRYILRLDGMLGGFAAELVAGREGVMAGYLLLQVIEERAVVQFPEIASVLDAFDPEAARVVRAVTRDEERHVKYAKAISKRYAPDAATLEATLARFREVEARAFVLQQQAFLRFAVDAELMEVGRAERLFWRAVSRAS